MAGRRALAAAAAILIAAAAPRPAAGRSAAPPTIGGSYRHVATWSNEPWQLRAGWFAYAMDIAHGPDGDRWVLDAVQSAVHRIRSDGQPRAVWPLAAVSGGEGGPGDVGAEQCIPRRLAVRPAGDGVAVMAICTGQSGTRRTDVAHYAPDGRRTGGFSVPVAYRDLAFLRDGRLILARSEPRVPPTPSRVVPFRAPGGLDVYTLDGVHAGTIEGPELDLAIAVDVAPDGTVYVVNWLPYPGAPPGAPEPTPRPSGMLSGLLSGVRSGMLPARTHDAVPVEGVVRYDAALRYLDATPFDGADDVAAGRSVYVARADEVFELGRAEPIWSAPSGALYVPYRHRLLALTVDSEGSLAAALDHCWFQGIVELGPGSADGPIALHGELDRPALAGPFAPLRLAAGRTLRVLGARFQPLDTPGRAPVRIEANGEVAPEPQSIVQLRADGRLVDQRGVCGDDLAFTEPGSTANWARDVASVGDWVFEGGPEIVTAWRAADDRLPAWQLWLGSVAAPGGVPDAGADAARPRLAAIDARDGRLAILDQGRGLVILVPLTGALADPSAAATAWSVRSFGRDVPTDLAMANDQVYLAYGGSRRVVVASLDGRRIDAFDVDDAPLAIAPATVEGAADDVLILGRNGWGLRYADGVLVARWRLPAPFGATDISPLPDGRVGVSFLRGPPVAIDDPGAGRTVEEGGVWVFAPDEAAPSPHVLPGACLVEPDKSAAPAEVRLGDPVTITLRVAGTCPPARDTTDLVLVVDTSRSMSWEGALDRAASAVVAVLGALNAAETRAAVVAYADDGLVVEPWTSDIGGLAQRIAALSPLGDTRLAGGLAAADQVLRDTDGLAARQAVLIVTDGELKDYPQAVARSLADRNVALYALAIPRSSYDYGQTRALAGLVGAGHVFVDPDAAAAALLAATLAGERSSSDLLATAIVTDTLPADMAYLDGSAVPDAEYDPPSRTLHWRIPAVPLTATLTLRYAVRPAVVGLRPTNVAARLVGRDGVGRDQALIFPVPSVKVWDRASLAHRAYLPIAIRGACVRPPEADIVLVLDASSSMDEPATPLPGTKLDAAKAAALTFAGRLGAHGARAGLVSFATDAVVALGLTTDVAALARAMDAITTAPGTRLDRGLATADDLLTRGRRPGARTAIVLLTDGRASAPDADVLAAAAALGEHGTTIAAIALGADADVALLTRAAGPDGIVVRAGDAAEVAGAFEEVFERLRCRSN
ncbi:MAG: VWA domain-containing protein [Ardenticatenales bacterium]